MVQSNTTRPLTILEAVALEQELLAAEQELRSLSTYMDEARRLTIEQPSILDQTQMQILSQHCARMLVECATLAGSYRSLYGVLVSRLSPGASMEKH